LGEFAGELLCCGGSRSTSSTRPAFSHDDFLRAKIAATPLVRLEVGFGRNQPSPKASPNALSGEQARSRYHEARQDLQKTLESQ
jgi:hypothetical protein